MQATHPGEEATLARSSALNDLRIVDLSTIAAAPSCSQTLGDLGADVIKVEPPGGDDTRRLGAVIEGQSTQFRGTNRNKRGVSLDLTRVQGQEVLLRMLEGADILLENFKTGTLERWGLGYEDVLAHRFPRLIHCRVTGFGATGPYGGFPGYDGIAQALGGVLSLNGETDGAPGAMAGGAAAGAAGEPPLLLLQSQQPAVPLQFKAVDALHGVPLELQCVPRYNLDGPLAPFCLNVLKLEGDAAQWIDFDYACTLEEQEKSESQRQYPQGFSQNAVLGRHLDAVGAAPIFMEHDVHSFAAMLNHYQLVNRSDVS